MTPARPLESLRRHALTPLHCRYEGFQKGYGSLAGFKLFTILQSIPGHPVESTLAEPTLTEAGYRPVTTTGAT